MKQKNQRSCLLQFQRINPTVHAIIYLLAATFTTTIASAQELSTYEHVENNKGILQKISGDGPYLIVIENNIVREASLWEQTKILSNNALQATVAISENTWNDTQAFLDTDENLTWTYITGSGIGMATLGASSISTISVLGITFASMPVLAPLAICTGTAIAATGATALILENIDDY
jgi:hypothetical protein